MNKRMAGLGIVAALGVFGCSGATNEGADHGSEAAVGELSTPLATIALAGGQTVEFYDMEGVVAYTESAPLGTPSMLIERRLVNKSAQEVFEALAPGQPLPAALAEVLARIAAQPATVAAEPTAEQLKTQGEAQAPGRKPDSGVENLGRVEQAYTTLSQFKAGGGCETSFADPLLFNTCRSWSGNGYWAAWWSKNAFYQAASGAGGAFTMQATLANFAPLLVVVNANEWKAAGWQGNGAPGTQLNRLDVTGASGDTFRVSSVFYNN